MPKILDLNELADGGKVELSSFEEKLRSVDWDSFRDQVVQIKGCAPIWAHLMVAGRLFGKASRVEFLMDDRQGGVPIEVFTTKSKQGS